MKKLVLFFLLSIACFKVQGNAAQNNWVNFVVAIEHCDEGDKAVFKEYLTLLKQANILPFWQATVFYQAVCNGSLNNPDSALKEFVREYGESKESIEKFMQFLQRTRQTANTLQLQCNNGFMNPGSVENAWSRVKKELIDPLSTESFCSDFKNSPFICKALACDVMREAIDTIDMVIKTVKMSNSLAVEKRMDFFASMLTDFHQLFQNLARILPANAFGGWSPSSYLRSVEYLASSILNNRSTAMFHKSREFSVQAAVMGSHTAFERHYPQTAEDLFMLIHQNSLAIVSALAKDALEGSQGKALNDVLDMPELLRQAMSTIEDSSSRKLPNAGASHPQRIGIVYTAQGISVHYNMPMQNHSSTFQIKYDRATGQCLMAIQFLGQARTRWQEIANLVSPSPVRSQLHFGQQLNLDERGGIVEWEWIIKQQDDVVCIKKYLAYCARISFGNSVREDQLERLERGPSTLKHRIQLSIRRTQGKVFRSIKNVAKHDSVPYAVGIVAGAGLGLLIGTGSWHILTKIEGVSEKGSRENRALPALLGLASGLTGGSITAALIEDWQRRS